MTKAKRGRPPAKRSDDPFRKCRNLRAQDFERLFGIQSKQRVDWENRYGIPCGKGRRVIDLFKVAAMFRELIAKNARVLVSGRGTSSSLTDAKRKLEIRKLELQVKNQEADFAERAGRLVPLDSLQEGLTAFCDAIRNAGDQLGRKGRIEGKAAQALINKAVRTAMREVEKMKADSPPENGLPADSGNA